MVAAARRKRQGTRYVLADGTAVFWLHYRTRGGVRRRYKIGSAGGVPLDAERALAMGVLAEVARGSDAAAQKRSDAQNAKTVRSYLEDVYEPQKLKHRKANNGAIAKAHILAAWASLLDVALSALTRSKSRRPGLARFLVTSVDSSGPPRHTGVACRSRLLSLPRY